MRLIFGLVLILGVALAGFAVFMAQNYIGQSEARLNAALEIQQKTGTLVQVYAAKAPVKFGQPLTKENVRKVWLQERFLPKGTYNDEASLFPPNADKPRYVTRALEANEVILASRLTEPGQVASLAGKLGEGFSAFQIHVSTNAGVAGFVMPDDHIDVYWTGSSGNGEVTRLIESALLVIAVDHASEQESRSQANARTVTVAVSREQVARLAQAQATGQLTMSLLASADEQSDEAIQIDHRAILGREAPAPIAEKEPECTIRTRKGNEVHTISIPCTN